jgi:uncharacterized membrane protein
MVITLQRRNNLIFKERKKMNETKHIAKSKTVWFNVLVAIFIPLSENLDTIHQYLSEGGYMIVAAIVSAVNVYLRTITDKGVSM